MGAKIVMGLETEYGGRANHYGSGSMGLPEAGQFFSNGARFYVDCGHPEYATPECADPWALVACAKAGDRLVAKWAESNVGGILSLASSLVPDDGYEDEDDDEDDLVTWGSHESYSIPGWHESGLLGYEQLKPHVASRMIVCGAGGFVKSGRGLKFCVSPRLTDTDRNHLVDTKDDRIHLACGESLCSETALFIRFASTSLIMLGLRHCNAVTAIRRAFPHSMYWEDAMTKWAEDPNEYYDGHTAFSVQRTLVKIVKDFVHDPEMPAWAPQAWQVWSDNLDAAENDPGLAATRLDWALKKALYGRFKGTRAQKAEMDFKFGALDGSGTFANLDKQGLLDHKIVPESAIIAAMESPPQDTRAAARGKAISAIHEKYGNRVGCAASWHLVIVRRHDGIYTASHQSPPINYEFHMPNPYEPDGGARKPFLLEEAR